MTTANLKICLINLLTNALISYDLHVKTGGKVGLFSLFLLIINLLVFINLIKNKTRELWISYVLGHSLGQVSLGLIGWQASTGLGAALLIEGLCWAYLGLSQPHYVLTSLFLNGLLILGKFSYLLILKRSWRE